MLTPVPPSDCTRARESASARLDGELVELQAAQLEAHLRACPDCQAYAVGIAASTGLLRAAALGQPSVPMFTPMPQRRRRIGLLPAVAAAAIMIAAAATAGRTPIRRPRCVIGVNIATEGRSSGAARSRPVDEAIPSA